VERELANALLRGDVTKGDVARFLYDRDAGRVRFEKVGRTAEAPQAAPVAGAGAGVEPPAPQPMAASGAEPRGGTPPAPGGRRRTG
jgi:hypothetical protein